MNPQRQRDLSLLLLRLVFGGFMLVSHGWGKLGKVLAGDFRFADPFGIGAAPSLVLAAGAEVFCAALLALGLFTRAAAIPLIVTMLTAAFVIHGADPFGKKEMALLYLAGFTAIFLMGPGKYALQRLLPERFRGRGPVSRFLLG
jgi:putative oxidoreductase